MSKPRSRSKLRPAPELIRDKNSKWYVRPGPGLVTAPDDKGVRTMAVPLNPTDYNKAIIKHEYCHVKFSPVPDRPFTETEQAVEDFRVNTLGIRAGLDFGAGFDPNVVRAKIAYQAASGDLKGVLLSRLVGLSVPPTDEVTNDATDPFMTDKMYHILHAAQQRLRRGIRDFQTTVEVARWIDEQFSTPEPPDEDSDQDSQTFDPGKDARTGAVKRSGTLRIETPPLTRQVKIRNSQSRISVTDSGVIMYRPNRYIVDRRVFKRRKTHLGGTILIDNSGSMSLKARDIAQLVESRPAATIAIYAGDHSDGILRIIVKNGKACEESLFTLRMGGNIVDYPALLWLNKQKGPRHWICDGIVTGIGDQQSPVITSACDSAQRAGKVVRFNSVADYIKNNRATTSLADCR